MCKFTAGSGARTQRRTKGAACGSARRFAAAGNSQAAETHVHAAVGRMAARAAERSDGSKLLGPCAGTGAVSSPGRRSFGLDGFSRRENHLFSSLLLLFFERVLPPTPRRIILRLR